MEYFWDYSEPWNILVYVIAMLLLPWSSWSFWRRDWNIFVVAAIFLVWDIVFIADPTSLAGRDPGKILTHAHGARDYMRWMFPIYAIVLSAVMAFDERRQAIGAVLKKSALSYRVFVAPLVIAMVLLLFVPIQIGGEQATNALKAHFTALVFGEQMVVFILAHIFLKLILCLRKPPEQGTAAHVPSGITPLDILKVRLAMGEIGPSDFEERRQVLGR